MMTAFVSFPRKRESSNHNDNHLKKTKTQRGEYWVPALQGRRRGPVKTFGV
jgi:hypothetical protein